MMWDGMTLETSPTTCRCDGSCEGGRAGRRGCEVIFKDFERNSALYMRQECQYLCVCCV